MIRCCIFDDFIPAFRSAIGEGPFSFSKTGTKIHCSNLSPANSLTLTTTYKQSTCSNCISITKWYESLTRVELKELFHSFKDTWTCNTPCQRMKVYAMFMLISDEVSLSVVRENKSELVLLCSLVDYIGIFHCTFGLARRYDLVLFKHTSTII